jgi:hypothetical protein
MNEQITDYVLSKSLKPYVWIFGISLLTLIIGLIFNIGIIGSIFGGSLAAIFPKFDPLYFIGVIAIYFVRRPYLSLIAVFFLAAFYQIYLSEFVEGRKLLGTLDANYFSLNRFYGGALLLSFIGSCHSFLGNKIFRIPDSK